MMKEGADVYRVRDNQREATLIIVIGVLGLCRSVVQRERVAVCALEKRVNYARRGSKGRHPTVVATYARAVRALERASA